MPKYSLNYDMFYTIILQWLCLSKVQRGKTKIGEKRTMNREMFYPKCCLGL